jgi:type II secretory pathway pseudopilin PulG
MYFGRKNLQSGFSLLEIAVILLIVSLIAGAAFGLAPKKEYDNAERITKTNLDKIEKAILAYYNDNGVLPCPASLTDTSSSIGQATNCFAAVAGTFDNPATLTIQTIRYGAVPTYDLSLPLEVGIDGWGNRIYYAVPKFLTSVPSTFDTVNVAGSIVITDSGNNVINNSTAAYILGAPGNNHIGAYSFAGSEITACSGTSDAENCNLDATFKDTFLTFSATVADYDDYFRWKTIKQVRKEGNYQGAGSGAYLAAAQWSKATTNSPVAPGWSHIHGLTEDFNLINGASLSTMFVPNDLILLPEGKYVISITASGCAIDQFYILLYDWTNDTAIPNSASQHASSATNVCSRATAKAYKEVPAGTTSQLMLYIFNATGNPIDGEGRNTGVGFAHVFSEIQIWQIRNE